MLLSESGFTFGGKHSYDDMGLIYAEKDGHIAIPEIKRNAYSIAGASGTLLLPGETWQPFILEGTLYPALEPATQADAQDLLREVAAWLTGGRQKLIFDYEPNVYYLAELSASCKWSLRNWFGGELAVRWTAQPFAYNVDENTSVTSLTGNSVQMGLNLIGTQRAPLTVKIENTGLAAISEVRVADDLYFQGINLGAGQSITITTEPPAGARIQRSGGSAEDAMPYAALFRPVTLAPGMSQVIVRCIYDYVSGDTTGMRVTLSARGRW